MGAQLIVLSGPTLGGKSTLAAAVAGMGPRIFHLEMDRILDEIIHNSSHEFDDRVRGYEEMHRRADSLLLQGQCVVVECTYSRRQYREGLAAHVSSTCRAVLVECYVTPAEAVRRFADRRGHGAVDLTEERVRRSAAEFPYSNLGIICTETEPLSDRLTRIAELLEGGPLLDFTRWIEFGL